MTGRLIKEIDHNQKKKKKGKISTVSLIPPRLQLWMYVSSDARQESRLRPQCHLSMDGGSIVEGWPKVTVERERVSHVPQYLRREGTVVNKPALRE